MTTDLDKRYEGCITGEDCRRRDSELALAEEHDIFKAREAHRNFWVHKIMAHYKCSYAQAEREFDQYGTMRLP